MAVLILAAALLPCVVFAGTSSPDDQRAEQVAFETLLRHTSEILGIPEEELSVNRPFAGQTIPGDDLDIVEIVMTVEDELGISMDDAALGVAVDTPGLADRLTIRQLQEVAARALAR